MQPELVADTRCTTGENPLWHPTERCVYWVDIPPGHLYRYEPSAETHSFVYCAGEAIGGFTIQSDGALLLFMARGAVKTWHNGSVRTVIGEIPEQLDSRFNDVIADPAGRVFCGTMATHAHRGSLYRLDRDRTLTTIFDDIGISNGLGFSPDRKTVYYADSSAGAVYAIDYDQAAGSLTNRRVLHATTTGAGFPDGLTVDAEGFLWVARWGESCIVRLSPDGVEVERVMFPARKVSCPTFGGQDYGDLYVTTAGGHAREEEGIGAGALFRFRPAGGGVPEFPSRITV